MTGVRRSFCGILIDAALPDITLFVAQVITRSQDAVGAAPRQKKTGAAAAADRGNDVVLVGIERDNPAGARVAVQVLLVRCMKHVVGSDLECMWKVYRCADHEKVLRCAVRRKNAERPRAVETCVLRLLIYKNVRSMSSTIGATGRSARVNCVYSACNRLQPSDRQQPGGVLLLSR